MLDTTEDILELLKVNGSENYHTLKNMIERDIPITPIQANLMFLRRGYGKSWMSYILVLAKIEESVKDEISIGMLGNDICIERFDEDATNRNRVNTWINQFKMFMESYASDYKLVKWSQGSLTYKRVDDKIFKLKV